MIQPGILSSLVVVACSMLIVMTTLGHARDADFVDKAVAAYHDAVKKEHQAYGTLEKTQQILKKAENRLEKTTQSDTAIETALDKLARVETQIERVTKSKMEVDW